MKTIGQFALSTKSRRFIVKYDEKGAIKVRPNPPFSVLLAACREVESRLVESGRQAVFDLIEA